MQLELSVKRGLAVAFALGAGLLALLWVRASAREWRPELLAPRPTRCPPGPHGVDLSLPWPETGTGQLEFPLSANGCLRLREDALFGHRRRWQLLELQPDGHERVLLEADFRWNAEQVGSALVLQQPYAPEAFPAEWRDRGFARLAWNDAQGSTVRTFEPSRREVTEVRTVDGGVERRTEALPAFNAERNPQGPRERFPDF